MSDDFDDEPKGKVIRFGRKSTDSVTDKPFTPPELQKRANQGRGRPRVAKDFDLPLTPSEERFVDALMVTDDDRKAAEMAGIKVHNMAKFLRHTKAKPNVMEALRQRIIAHHSRKPTREFLQKNLLEMATNPMIGPDTKHKVIRTLSEMQGFLQNQNAGGNFNLNFNVVSPDGKPLPNFQMPTIDVTKPEDEK